MDNYYTPLEIIKENYNSAISKNVIQKFKNVLSNNCIGKRSFFI